MSKHIGQVYKVGHGYCHHDAVALFRVYLPFLKAKWDNGADISRSFTDINGVTRQGFVDKDGVLTLTSDNVNDKALITLSEYAGGKVTVSDGFETTTNVDHLAYKMSGVHTDDNPRSPRSRLRALKTLNAADYDEATSDIIKSLERLSRVRPYDPADQGAYAAPPVSFFLPSKIAEKLYEDFLLKGEWRGNGGVSIPGGLFEIDCLASESAIDFVRRYPKHLAGLTPVTLSGPVEASFLTKIMSTVRSDGMGVNDFIEKFRPKDCDAGDISPSYRRALQSASLATTESRAISNEAMFEMSELSGEGAGCVKTLQAALKAALNQDSSYQIKVVPGLTEKQDCIVIHSPVDEDGDVFVHIDQISEPGSPASESDRLVRKGGFIPVFVTGPADGVASTMLALNNAFEDTKAIEDVVEQVEREQKKAKGRDM